MRRKSKETFVKFSAGDLVFAKEKGGYSYWPGKVKEVIGHNLYLVKFFGQNSEGRIYGSSLLYYNDENCAKYNNERQMSRKEYVESVNAIEKFIKSKQRKKICRKKRQSSVVRRNPAEQPGLISEIHQIQYRLLKETVDTQHFSKYFESIDKVSKGLDVLNENLPKASAFMLCKYPEILQLQQTLCYFKKHFSRYEMTCKEYRSNLKEFKEKAEVIQKKAERNLQIIKDIFAKETTNTSSSFEKQFYPTAFEIEKIRDEKLIDFNSFFSILSMSELISYDSQQAPTTVLNLNFNEDT